MIDVHCHLNFHTFSDDVEDIVKQAKEAGITHIVNVGTKLNSSQEAVELAKRFDICYAIVGVHPHHADKITLNSKLNTQNLKQLKQNQTSNDKNMGASDDGEDWITQLESLAKHEKVIGIGECGLDYYSYKSNDVVDPDIQKKVFEAQIELSHRLNLPLQIHNRQAGEDVIKIIKRHKNLLKNPPGMFHCFASTYEVLKEALDLGFYIGFDGNITYKGIARGETVELSELVRATPLDRILVETDSPFLTPEPLRGERNTPKNVIIVAEYIALLKNVSYATLEEAVYNNFTSVFHIE